MVKIERKSSDGSLDYFLSEKSAKHYYDNGKLSWDITNGCYCHNIESTSYDGKLKEI